MRPAAAIRRLGCSLALLGLLFAVAVPAAAEIEKIMHTCGT